MKELMMILRKEFIHILRDRITLLLVLAMPVMLVLLFGFTISTEINNAKIANATIERLKIVGHTLTEVASYYNSAQVWVSGTGEYKGWQDLASITITTEAGYSTPIVFTASLSAV